MDTVVGEIAKMFSGRGNGGDGDDGAGDEGGRVGDNGDGDGDSAAASRGVAMQRADEPRDDYTHGGANVMRAFWPLFVLGRGLPLTRTLNKEDYRHLMCYYDLRFARDLFLVLHLANVIMRHEVNRAVGARVNSSAAPTPSSDLLHCSSMIDRTSHHAVPTTGSRDCLLPAPQWVLPKDNHR